MDRYDNKTSSATIIKEADLNADFNEQLSNTADNYIAFYSHEKVIVTIDKDSFINYLRERFKKILTVSDEAISSLKKTLDYNGHYIAYLLDQLSDEEFNKIAETYAVNLSSEESDELIEKIKILFMLSKESFSSSDLSNMFKIEEGLAEKILMHLKETKFLDSAEGLSK